MDYLHATLLALLQGLTEFLPISSSAHLILLPELTGWEDQGLAFDVAVHVGTLAAVLLYFRREVARTTLAWLREVRGGEADRESRLAWSVIIATLPVLVLGLLIELGDDAWLRSPQLIAGTTLFFGILLWWADRTGTRERDEYGLSLNDALMIGIAQALALIPGTSRSGITMTAALLLGVDRSGAARFSFLLSVPTIIAAGAFEGVELLARGEGVAWDAMALGAGVAAISAYLCIHWFLKLLERIGFTPFVLYRIALGTLLFIFYW